MRKIVFLLFIPLFLMIFAKSPPVPDDYPSSLPSARIKALGGAGTGLPGNITGSFYNPASASFLSQGFIHISYADESNATVSRLINNEPSVYGRHVSYLSIITFQGGLSYHPLYSESYADREIPGSNIERDLDVSLDEYILTLTSYSGASERYALPFVLGLNLKYLRGSFAQADLYRDSADIVDSAFTDISTGNGYGLDLGFLYKGGNFAGGISVRNLLTHIYWSGDSKDGNVIDYERQIIPLSATAGVSFFPATGLVLLLDIDRIFKSDMPFIYKGGIEYTFYRQFSDNSFLSSILTGSPSIRGGAVFKEIYGLEVITFTLGLGYSSSDYRIDMAIEGLPDDYMQGGLTYQISINLPIKI